jgi:Zn-finger nucleic acid-binding protein
MRCPVDNSDMIVVEHQKIELDFCLRCTGVWIDAGELDLLVDRLTSQKTGLSRTDLMTPCQAEASENKYKCPVCSHKMDKAWLCHQPKILIDSCPLGDGLWFDGGELHQVLQQLAPQDAPDIASFLNNAFQATHHMIKKQE